MNGPSFRQRGPGAPVKSPVADERPAASAAQSERPLMTSSERIGWALLFLLVGLSLARAITRARYEGLLFHGLVLVLAVLRFRKSRWL